MTITISYIHKMYPSNHIALFKKERRLREGLERLGKDGLEGVTESDITIAYTHKMYPPDYIALSKLRGG